jgi:thiol-disulfide isomerase/thioredoxin
MPARARRLAALTVLSAAGGLLIAASPRVTREGEGERRATLAAMEAKPFDAANIAALSEWAGADPVAPEVFGAGGVVAFAFIDAANPAAMTMLNTLTRMARTDAERGLKVFAVHPEEGWDAIARLAEGGRLRIPVAKDAGGAFAKAMHADDTPDVYLVDRAGQLRYADVETRAVTVAVNTLLRETAEEAVENARYEERPGAPAGTASTDGGAAPAGRDAGSSPGAYAAASWPAHNTGELYGKNVQGRPLPVPLGSETWLTPRQDLTGKVIVLDFWATWCGPCIAVMPQLDQLQRKHPENLAVLGVAGQSRGSSYPEDASAIRNFMSKNKHDYGQLIDPQQRVYRSLEVRAIPHAVVLSTDGVVRWQGNPLSRDFRAAVEQVLKVDPGLK